MSSNLLYFEILELFQETEKRSEKIAVLRKYADRNFVEFLRLAFSPKVEFDVEIPEYSASIDPAGLNILYLHGEIPRLYRFIKDHPKRAPGLTQKKQQQLLIPILEALHHEEASLLVRCIKKDLRIPFLTKKLIKEAFPEIDLGEEDGDE